MGHPSDAPALRWFAITKHDSNKLPFQPRSIYVGGAGTVRAKSSHGDVADFIAPAGGTIPICPEMILETGTTATGLVGLL